jgi:4-amino-4-deoxy-L-arabinose transferase-like glycosyltransferase
LPEWWPLAALMVLAAALRFSTLDLQSFWYDEAFTPVHVLRASLFTTLHGMVHTENTPPLWYVLEWGISRVLGTGEVALRLLSAFAGLATVPVAWAIGRELSGRRATAIASAALVAVDPLFVWYSQEARAYGLFVLAAALAMLCFARACAEPSSRRLALFAVTASLALLTHYFAVFLLIPMIVWLLLASLRPRSFHGVQATPARVDDRMGGGGLRNETVGAEPAPAGRRAALFTCAAVAVVGFALIPLAVAQGGHGSQWIGAWALSSRLQAIPQYYLTGYSGAPLGHGIELLVALPIIAGVGLGLWRVLAPREERGALIALVLAACGVLLPIVLVALGADYLAPRNLIAAMIPVTALIAILLTGVRAGCAGPVLAGVVALAFFAISIDVDLSPRLQRGDWRGVARMLRAGNRARAITTVELGAAPLEYYLPPLRNLPRGTAVTVSEIDETGYAPLRSSAASPPAPGFRLLSRSDINGLIVYRFVSSTPRSVSEATLRRHVITVAHPEVLVPSSLQTSSDREKI